MFQAALKSTDTTVQVITNGALGWVDTCCEYLNAVSVFFLRDKIVPDRSSGLGFFGKVKLDVWKA